MTKSQKTARLHRFNDKVALSFPSTQQLYLTPEMANQLANELKRFAKNCSEKKAQWITTRLVDAKGKAVTESSNKAKIEYI